MVWLTFSKPTKPIAVKQPKKYVMSEASRKKMSLAKLGDNRCADNFGNFTKKGSRNPKAKSYLIRFPDGVERIVTGMREFLRNHDLTSHFRCRGREKGYVLLKTFDGHPSQE